MLAKKQLDISIQNTFNAITPTTREHGYQNKKCLKRLTGKVNGYQIKITIEGSDGDDTDLV